MSPPNILKTKNPRIHPTTSKPTRGHNKYFIFKYFLIVNKKGASFEAPFSVN